ncbi:hypothetical protein PT279_03375 [Bifidobacterium sp. ESL0784]|uniref:hypothetical protein n=1 Tax=Bifidobacterium sp. ESL0784 TaxID=2983231 RepID=UPI0023F6D6FB|nr:hypothetical protein [Bifidobacterium sp. ESL0784]MDF7640632.1 hypothetical protein [Bifidobacterium sp. ESL0784]
MKAMIDDACAARNAYVRLIDASVLLLTVTRILKTLKFRGFDEKEIGALSTFAAGKSLIGMIQLCCCDSSVVGN